MRWITAQQLEEWARARTSATDLPGVVSDLIRATAPDITAVRFPTGSKGQVRGFDGHLESVVEALNVPEGLSLWEIGTEADYRAKALKDFKKRSGEVPTDEQKNISLVFVTPFTWDSSKSEYKIENWVSERKTEAHWKDLRFIDGVALEEWLAECPAAAAWHARNTLKVAPPTGARSTDDFWNEFANRFNPPLTEQVVLCDRQAAVDQLIALLVGQPQRFNFIADSPDEVVAFAIAAIRTAKPEIRLFLESRALVVDSMAAGRELVLKSNQTFLLRNEAARSPGLFAGVAPTLVPLGRQQRIREGTVLERPTGFAMAQAMKTMGLSQERADMLARGSGRSLAALARQIPGGHCDDPPWMPNAELVLPSILAGAWDSSNELDRDVVRSLSKSIDYLTYEKQLRQFTVDADPPLDREGTAWKVRAPMDAFIHIGHLIGSDHLDQLRPILSDVFGRIDKEPSPNEELVFAPRKADRHSDWLREGLATTVLLIAVWEKQARLNVETGAGQRFADEVIGGLPGLASNPRLLMSLKNELPILAEAAPNPLLQTLELMLEGDGQTIAPIFNETEGLLFPTYHHTGVLWALETIAWDSNYFRRACLALANLAAIDPGVKLVNRPLTSLTEIFLPWHPGTDATLETKLALLDEIIQTQPDIAWGLLKQLLPNARTHSTGTARPKLREGDTTLLAPITYERLWKEQSAIIERVMALAVGSPNRVHELISPLTRFPPQLRERALAVVDDTLEHATGSDRQMIWATLREEIRKHERFKSAEWALAPGELAKLQFLDRKYAPDDPTVGVAELFDAWSLGTGISDETNKIKQAEAIHSLRADRGLEAVLRLAQNAKAPYLVTRAIEEANFSEEEVLTLLEQSFEVEPCSDLTIMLAGLYQRRAGMRDAEAWLNRHFAPGREEMIASFLLAWPVEPRTWLVARRLGTTVLTSYWKKMHPHWLQGPRRILLAVAWNLLRHDRARAALRTILDRLPEVPSHFILRILDNIVPEINRRDSIPDEMSGYELEQAFKALDERPDVQEVEIARREYALLPLLEHQDRHLKLHSLMTKDPEFFHQILRDVYRGDNEEQTEEDEHQRARWRQAYALLSKFSAVPGFDSDPPEQKCLSIWIDRVRDLGKETDRTDVTESTIGRVLAHAPSDDIDSGWPHRFIRNEIERSRNDALPRGLQIERFNMRGATTRGVFDGGAQERELASRYREDAAKSAAWPRTAAMLRAIAENWEQDAEREDLAARQRRLRS